MGIYWVKYHHPCKRLDCFPQSKTFVESARYPILNQRWSIRDSSEIDTGKRFRNLTVIDRRFEKLSMCSELLPFYSCCLMSPNALFDRSAYPLRPHDNCRLSNSIVNGFQSARSCFLGPCQPLKLGFFNVCTLRLDGHQICSALTTGSRLIDDCCVSEIGTQDSCSRIIQLTMNNVSPNVS